jgi:molybdopterin-guanine dinucleotide biosynthesis adapter protein
MTRYSGIYLKEAMAENLDRNGSEPPVISIVGKSGSGKTTLMVNLIEELSEKGLRIGSIKHHLHNFEMDSPGKDSWRHKQAGAERSMVASPSRIGLTMDVDHDFELDELLHFFAGMDIVLAEGYKGGTRPKVEIFRSEVYDKPICLDDENLIAMVTDEGFDLNVPRFGLNDIQGLSDFLISRFDLQVN